MLTLNQLIKKSRKKIIKKSKKPILKNAPQRKGTCYKVFTTSPKKPNSAVRKICRVKLNNSTMITAAIPGHGHNLQKCSVVLVRGGRIRDVPGVQYKLIKGKYDFNREENIFRVNARSKYSKKKN